MATSRRPTVNNRGGSFPGYSDLNSSRHCSNKSSTVFPPSDPGLALQTNPFGLFNMKYVCSFTKLTPPSTTLPSTMTTSVFKLTFVCGAVIVVPFTFTRPPKIKSSAPRLLATPSDASALFNRSPSSRSRRRAAGVLYVSPSNLSCGVRLPFPGCGRFGVGGALGAFGRKPAKPSSPSLELDAPTPRPALVDASREDDDAARPIVPMIRPPHARAEAAAVAFDPKRAAASVTALAADDDGWDARARAERATTTENPTRVVVTTAVIAAAVLDTSTSAVVHVRLE